MRLTMSIESDSNAQNSPVLLKCPYCRKSIPDISLLKQSGQMSVFVRCSCLKEDKFASLQEFMEKMGQSGASSLQCNRHTKKADKYCIDCTASLCKECQSYHNDFVKKHKHVLIEDELEVKCSKHDLAYSFFCKQCYLNICNECKQSHNGHPLLFIEEVETSSIELKALDELIEANKQKVEAFIERITIRSHGLNEMKTDIQSVFASTHQINICLKDLYQSLLTTAVTLKSFRLYQLTRMRSTIKLNSTSFKEEDQSIEEHYVKLKRHLQMNFILSQDIDINKCHSSLTGHDDDYVVCLCQLKDERIASGSCDCFIKLWDALSCECRVTLKGHKDYVMSLLQLKDGRLASGSCDFSIKLWDLTSNRCLFTLSGHSNPVVCLIQLINDRLASASWDGSIRLWDLITNDCKATLALQNCSIECIVQLNDGQVASGGSNNAINVWDISSKACTATLKGHSGAIQSIVQLKNCQLASASCDSLIKLWDLTTKECTATLTGHSNYVLCLILLNDGRLASASRDNSIKVWDMKSEECTITLKGHSLPVLSLIQLEDGRLVSASRDTSIKLWFISN